MIAYALPTGEGCRILWTPAPRFCWGELKGLGNTITVLSPDAAIDVKKIPMLLKDNVHRPVVRKTFSRRTQYRIGRLMLWGFIWLIGMDQPVEDIVGGLYLLLGLPLFAGLLISTFKQHLGNVLERFNSLFYTPNIKIVYSKRLRKLEGYLDSGGATEALRHLDELGFGHLREFYKRAAWQTRWSVPPPTGAGLI